MNHFLLVFVLVVFNMPDALSQLNRFKITKSRASSKFSLNPLKPLMKFVRDPLKASAQRHHPKYLPPPPNMFHPPPPPPLPPIAQVPPTPHRISTSVSSIPWQRYYNPPPTKMLPPSTISLMPPMTALPSSLVFSSLAADRNYKPVSYQAMSALSSLPSDIQIKTLRLPSRYRKPSLSNVNLNLADSVVRQLLDYPNQESMPSVLVIEDPDISTSSSASQNSDVYSDFPHKSAPTYFVAPSINGGDISDSSADLSLSNSASSNPDVFVIVSKNSKNRGLFGGDDKKSDLTSLSTSPKMKKYKISTTLDDFGSPSGSRQVWIIKR